MGYDAKISYVFHLSYVDAFQFFFFKKSDAKILKINQLKKYFHTTLTYFFIKIYFLKVFFIQNEIIMFFHLVFIFCFFIKKESKYLPLHEKKMVKWLFFVKK
jgi:hypothetical protein